MGEAVKKVEEIEGEKPSLITALLNLITPESISGLISTTTVGNRITLTSLIERRFLDPGIYSEEDNVVPIRAEIDFFEDDIALDREEEEESEVEQGELSSSQFILMEKKRMEALDLQMRKIKSQKIYGAASKVIIVKKEKTEAVCDEDEVDIQGKGLMIDKRRY